MSSEHTIRRSLTEKGWEQRHIDEAVAIFARAQQNKHPRTHFYEHAIFWLSLFLAIAGNFIVSLSLIPALLFLKGWALYLVVSVWGISFGMLFEMLVRSMQHLERGHHILLSFLIPLLAILTLISVSLFSNQLQAIVNLHNQHNSLVVALVYCVFFMLPYFGYMFFLRK